MKNLLIGTLAVAVIGLGVALVRTNQKLNDRVAELEKLQTVKPAPQPKPVRVATIPVTPAQPSGATEIKPPATKSFQAGFGTNFMSALAGMMKNPYMKETMKAQQKVAVDKMYGDLLKSLTNLTDEQKNQLHEMLVERQQFQAEAGMTMMTGSAEEKKKAVELMKEAKAGYEQVVRDLFGPETTEAFKQYEDHLPEHGSLAMFKGSLPAADAMSAQQESDLIAALYQERKSMPTDSLLNKGGQPPDPTQFSEEMITKTLQQMEQLQQRNLSRAEAILTPTQLEQYKQYQKQMANMQAIGLKMATQMFGQQPKAGAAAP
ncbi:MAG: hypothetical protein NTY53_14760 [Kiritimatiellaeota bacterium]|nr:hypothetical protein [Kiritimatiellota bacterium]